MALKVETRGFLGKLGGIIMARANDACGAWVTELLNVASNETVLEVGFGPGTAIRRLSAVAAHVAGVDASREMVAQAKARNAIAVKNDRVELLHGTVDDLPFAGDTFHKAMAINSMQIWPDAIVGLREMRRVLKSGDTIALGFTRYSGQRNEGLTERLSAAGFIGAASGREGQELLRVGDEELSDNVDHTRATTLLGHNGTHTVVA
jgi:ubiquinone/menaquinone biosynthesis C-methylase UbiE